MAQLPPLKNWDSNVPDADVPESKRKRAYYLKQDGVRWTIRPVYLRWGNFGGYELIAYGLRGTYDFQPLKVSADGAVTPVGSGHLGLNHRLPSSALKVARAVHARYHTAPRGKPRARK